MPERVLPGQCWPRSGPRSLNKQVLNALAQSGGDIRIYTPLEAGQAARKVENVSSVRLASDQVRQSTGETNLDTAIQASRERLMSDAEQAVNLAIPRAQQGQVVSQRKSPCCQRR
ncbi:conjugal transfer nickase/helicase TraI [Escherichia coli]|uniref:hypothetical protein n=1 Tax=Escherichia coli TaxID=562 RepID=UPI000E056AFA|nr:hypothetical protein [Escherichia coli]STJ03362.1 conjugal transfer nickase/helicase TraI [Escherichia coli]